VLRQFDQPNSVFILGGIGLFYGHICYRVLNNLEKKKKGLMFFIVVTVAIIIILFYKFNILNASIVIFITSIISILLDTLTTLRAKERKKTKINF